MGGALNVKPRVFAMQTLEEFIAARRLELGEVEAKLSNELLSVREEMRKLDKAALAAGIFEKPASEPEKQASTIVAATGSTPRRVRSGTMKDAVVRALTDSGGALTANDLLPLVNEILNMDYLRSSLSPQLSRLKDLGIVELHGKLWSLPSNEKPADVNSLGEPSTGLFETPVQDREAGRGGAT